MSFLIKLQQNLSLFWQNVFFHICTLQATLKNCWPLLKRLYPKSYFILPKSFSCQKLFSPEFRGQAVTHQPSSSWNSHSLLYPLLNRFQLHVKFFSVSLLLKNFEIRKSGEPKIGMSNKLISGFWPISRNWVQ